MIKVNRVIALNGDNGEKKKKKKKKKFKQREDLFSRRLKEKPFDQNSSNVYQRKMEGEGSSHPRG